MVLMMWAWEMDNVQESNVVYQRLSNAFEVKQFIEDCPMLLNQSSLSETVQCF